MDDTVRKFAWEEIRKNIMMDGDTMIHREIGEVLGPEVDLMYWKDEF